MTDQELKDLVASLAISQKENSEQLKLTDKQIKGLSDNQKETDRILKENSEQLKLTDKQIKDLSDNQKETERILKENSEQTDKQIKGLSDNHKEIDRILKENSEQLKELGKQIGGLGEKFGSFTEGMAFPSMQKILIYPINLKTPC